MVGPNADTNVTRMETGVRISGLTELREPKTVKVDNNGNLRVNVVNENMDDPPAQRIDQITPHANEVVTKQGSKVSVQSNSGKTSATVTRPSDNAPYTEGDVVGGLFQFADVLPNIQNFIVTGLTLRIGTSVIPVGIGGFKLHLFHIEPASFGDNIKFILSSLECYKYIGYIQIASPSDLGENQWSQNDNVNFNGQLSSGNIYGYLVTDNAYTPTSDTNYVITLYTVGV